MRAAPNNKVVLRKGTTAPPANRNGMPFAAAADADFIAAKPSRWVRGFFRSALPFLLPRLGVAGVDYEPADLDRLRALAGERVLLAPNHPTNTEPALLFHLSCAVDRPFSYLACREAFEPLGGLWGQVIRRIGAFSVVRGTADRASFRATREMLARPGAKVVIFPEGEVYSQNDSLLPFHSGVFQLAFWALEDVRKAGETNASLFVLPVALKYRFTCDMSQQILASLARLERFTGVAEAEGNAYARLRRVGEAMLHSLEREYRLTPPAKEKGEAASEKVEAGLAPTVPDLTPRLDAVKEAILARVAAAAGVALPKGETLPERMRALIHVIETVTREEPGGQGRAVVSAEAPDAKTPYDIQLQRLQRERARPLFRDLSRLANWIAVYDGYVAADPTPERMADTLQRLERECFGEAKLRGPRRCRVRLGEPLDLAGCLGAYGENRRREVARVAHEVEARVAALLTAPGSPRLPPGPPTLGGVGPAKQDAKVGGPGGRPAEP